jgi:hypothetical protein
MKKIYILFGFILFAVGASAQDFAKNLGDARTSYSSGKLEDARFAMQQLLQEIDMKTGKEILKMLPAKMQEQNVAMAKDNVAGASGFAGVTIHREYGTTEDKTIELDIITNSPLLGSINALLSIPLLGNAGDNKVIKIAGYKAMVQKVSGSSENSSDYEIQMPLNNSLITLRAPGYTQDQVIKMANTLPVAEIAKMIQ